ncbi:MAG: hypothetical protein V1852_00095 [Pseudomonadota bacterium]
MRLEWYDYALDMLIDGLSPKEIRGRLDEYICERQQSGGYGERGEQTYTKAVTQIMKCWVSPDRELTGFRNDALLYAQRNKRDMRIALHWATTIAAYPFWHRVAAQVGRLLNLQNTVTQSQIRTRCFEAMGERTTVERSSRRVIRSFVAWEALKDADEKGCYQKATSIVISDPKLLIIMFEAALYATPDGKGAMGVLLNNPAFFAFQFPVVAGDFISQNANRMEVVRYGLDDVLLKLKK